MIIIQIKTKKNKKIIFNIKNKFLSRNDNDKNNFLLNKEAKTYDYNNNILLNKKNFSLREIYGTKIN